MENVYEICWKSIGNLFGNCWELLEIVGNVRPRKAVVTWTDVVRLGGLVNWEDAGSCDLDWKE